MKLTFETPPPIVKIRHRLLNSSFKKLTICRFGIKRNNSKTIQSLNYPLGAIRRNTFNYIKSQPDLIVTIQTNLLIGPGIYRLVTFADDLDYTRVNIGQTFYILRSTQFNGRSGHSKNHTTFFSFSDGPGAHFP